MNPKTISDVIAEFGSIKIRSGFGKFARTKNKYPTDRLTRLLNLDLNDEEKVIKFCEDYKIFVAPVNGKYSEGVKGILEPLKNCIDFYQKNKDLLPTHIKLINEQLSEVVFQLFKTDKQQINEINSLIDSDSIEISPKPSLQFEIKNTYPNSTVTLWESFAKLVIKSQEIKSCSNCGKYFIPVKKSHNQKYCSSSCQEKYKKKKAYHEKKNSP